VILVALALLAVTLFGFGSVAVDIARAFAE
jgi:hypothetical protein